MGHTVQKVVKNVLDITRNIEENEILHEIFRVVSRFPCCISCYISENRLILGQCTTQTIVYCNVECRRSIDRNGCRIDNVSIKMSNVNNVELDSIHTVGVNI